MTTINDIIKDYKITLTPDREHPGHVRLEVPWRITGDVNLGACSTQEAADSAKTAALIGMCIRSRNLLDYLLKIIQATDSAPKQNSSVSFDSANYPT